MMRSARQRSGFAWGLLLLTLGSAVPGAGAQELPSKLTLPQLISLGLERQPALTAARASLAAAASAQQGLDGLKLASLFAKDLPIRKQQACLGVTIAAASLEQAEWETRYAVVRNYYSVQYAREQLKVVTRISKKLDEALERAKKLVKIRNPDIKIFDIDVDILALNVKLVRLREIEARVGIEKAIAAVREAVGVECPLDIAEDRLPALVADLNKEALVAMALCRRGEMTQAGAAQQVATLEIDAQAKQRGPTGRTFASGSDLHARPIPQGVANGEYRPGAIGLEMPASFAGHKADRMQRAHDLAGRADAVVAKTHNLITLEVEATYLKWLEAAQKIKGMEGTIPKANSIADKIKEEFDEGKISGEQLLRAQGMEEQIAASYNEALYLHALALAALERVTAGGYRLTK